MQSRIAEEASAYHAEPPSDGFEALFHHESLDVYQVGLDFMRWFVELPGANELIDRLCREIDKSATSVVLNIAEGNGRYSELDHHRFIEIAAASTVRSAAYLDLYHEKISINMESGRELLSRIVAMLNRF